MQVGIGRIDRAHRLLDRRHVDVDATRVRLDGVEQSLPQPWHVMNSRWCAASRKPR